MESEIKVIDYLIENGGCDCCAKCVFIAQPLQKNSDVEPCKEFEKGGNIACRKGMITYFEREKAENSANKLINEFLNEIKKFGIAKLSMLSGVAQTTLTKWCSGEIVPTLVNAQKVASAMGLEFFLFENE